MADANYFGDGMDAKRYSRARPRIHPTAIERFRAIAGRAAPFDLALDVGCGTGQSTVVLTEIAKRVIGVDPSADMLAHAERHPNVEYVRSAAEHTPFPDGRFDLISAAQAYHWFDHDAFLAESHRLLQVPGWLVVYTSWFTGEIRGEPAFGDWFRGEYLSRYPTPPRNRAPITEDLARTHGFDFHGEDEFRNEVAMTIERFADYQLSTTNVISAVERGAESFDGAGRWIRDSMGRFFAGEHERVFRFSGKMWCLEKAAA
jgi:SAM-dependent methyltransferase